jgi:DNA-binding transcriptional LysR family regulator
MSEFDFLEFRHLKYVQAIAEAERFTSAASTLHVSQSSLSTQIKQLEGFYGVKIFIRDRDGVTGLTAAGQALLTGAREMLQLRDDTLRIMKALGAGSPAPLRLGFSSLVEKKLLNGIVELTRSLVQDCPITCEGDEIERLEWRVKGGELDGALITLPLEDCADLTISLIERERLVVCLRADDPLAAHEAIPAHQLNDRLALFEYPQAHHRAHVRLLEMLAAVSVVPKQCNPTQNREHIQWMVLQGQCYALIRSDRTLAAGLTTRPIHGADWTIDTALIVRPADNHPALAMLLREIRRRSWQFNCASLPWTESSRGKEKREDRRPNKKSYFGSELPLFEAS